MRLHGLATTVVLIGSLIGVPALGTPVAAAAPAAAAPAAAAAPVAHRPGASLPRAQLRVTATVSASGRVHLTARTDARAVRVVHRTRAGVRRTLVAGVRAGVARAVLPAGSRSILVRASATPTRDASAWQAVRPLAAPATDPAAAWEGEVLALVNRARAAGRTCGTTYHPAVPALTANAALAAAARAHSADMAANGYFSHTGLDGSTPWDRMRAVGYVHTAAGENIAAGQTGPAEVMAAWLGSPGHCANVMSPAFRELGVGYAHATGSPYGHYWTQDFGSR